MFFNFFYYNVQKGVFMKKLLFFLLLLTGCGFTPLYSQNNTYLTNTKVIVNPISNQYGDQMRRIIQNGLQTQAQNPKYQYRLIVKSPSFDMGDKTITSNEFASTMQVIGKTSYYLQNIQTNTNDYVGEVRAVSSYSVVKDPYATTVAQKHIKEELSKQLAEQITLDVLAKLSGVSP